MNRIAPFLTASLMVGLFMLASCGHDVSITTKYNTDGSLDRSLSFSRVDSAFVSENYFGLNEANGWSTEIVSVDSVQRKIKEGKLTIRFSRHFSDTLSANTVMDNAVDTLFHLRADIRKHYSWFYEYTRYTDTYRAINRFSKTPVEDFFTPEDFAFIDRLPAEGRYISKADSFYLKRLNESIEEYYLTHSVFDEALAALSGSMRKNGMEGRWIDTLYRHRNEVLNRMQSHDREPEDIVLYADSLGIPLPHPQVDDDFAIASKQFERRLNFMSQAYSATFSHVIELPDNIVLSNADSVAGKVAYWRPPVVKFVLRDYSMFAETRKLNVWAVGGAVLVIALTVLLFVRRKA